MGAEGPLTPKAIAIFWTEVDRSGECWVWTGKRVPKGYGRAHQGWAHRVSYELAHGPIPSGMQIDHLCRNTSCVNPEHLEAVTPRENTMRSLAVTATNARKTHCIHGHPFTEANTYLWMGQRKCLECQRARQRKLWKAREPSPCEWCGHVYRSKRHLSDHRRRCKSRSAVLAVIDDEMGR